MKATIAEFTGRDSLRFTVRELIKISGSSRTTKTFLLAFAHIKSEIIAEIISFYKADEDVIDITKIIARWADREEQRIHAAVALIGHALHIPGVRELILELATADKDDWVRTQIIQALLDSDTLNAEEAGSIVKANAGIERYSTDVIAECAAAYLSESDDYVVSLIEAMKEDRHPAQAGTLRGLIRRYDRELYDILFERYKYYVDLFKPLDSWLLQNIAYDAKVEMDDLIQRIKDISERGVPLAVRNDP
jgi:hypothetical protein